MKIYIAGGGGMLGDALYQQLVGQHELLITDIAMPLRFAFQYLDIRDFDEQRRLIKRFKPDIIMNLAALTDMEYCETNPMEAIETNAGGSANLTLIAALSGVPYVYISTAGIFGGEKDFYSDKDAPNPLSVYAKTKYYGEVVAKTYEKHYIIRPSWMMGGGHGVDNKFIGKIYEQIINGSTELNIVADKGGTPTYTHDLARTIDRLINSGQYDTYNCTCKGRATRYEVAKEFVRLLGLEKTVKINPVDSAFASEHLGYFAPRPRNEFTISTRLDESGFSCMRDWRDALLEYSKDFLGGRKATPTSELPNKARPN